MRARTHRKVPMKTKSLPTKQRALDYMADWDIPVQEGHTGYVHFWEGKGCGWALNPEPNHYRPGAVIVDVQTGAQFVGAGGNYDAGCERWEQLSHES